MISSLELAKICGVSQGTVDRALHGRPGISEKTKKKILEAAKANGYQPNPAARELITGKNKTVAAVIPSINGIFFMDLMNAAKNALKKNGYRFVLAPYDGKDEFIEALEDFSARRVVAAIAIPPKEDIELKTNLKVASLLGPCAGKNTAFISPDEEKTGIDAANYILKKKHKNVLHLTYANPSYAIEARKNGFIETIKSKGKNAFIMNDKQLPELYKMVKAKNISAIFCHNDWLALSATRELEKNGANLKNILVLGVDNSPTFTALCKEITTMQYPFEWVAEETVRFIEGKKISSSAPPFHIIEKSI
jgi:LacI family transcriptional regulator